MWTFTFRALGALVFAGVAVSCGTSGVSDSRPDGPATEPAALAALTADSADILEDLRFLSSDELQGRATGSAGAARAREHLAAAFTEAGLLTWGDGYPQAFTWTTGDPPTERAGVNLAGFVRGTEHPGRYIVVSGHYDHLGVRRGEIFNGADDNASGAVAVLALARALRGMALKNSVIFVAFDGEELGLRGARAFVDAPPVPRDSIAVDLNMDMVARTAGVLWAGGAYHTPELRPILEGVARRAPLDYRLGHDAPGAPEGDDWTHQSDQGPFQDVGIPFVYLGVEDHPDYHRPTDDFERVNPGEYMNALRAALLTLLALDDAVPLRETQP